VPTVETDLSFPIERPLYYFAGSGGAALSATPAPVVKKNLVSGLFWLNQMNESENQFRAMIDTMPGWAWSSRADGSTEFLNHSWLDYTGLPMEEGLGWAWKDRIHPADLEQLLRTWQRLMDSGQPGEEQARLQRSDGEYRWFLFRAVPVRNEHGEVIRWYGTNTDIEDLKRTEALLSAEKRTLTDVLEKLTTSEAKLRRDEAELRAIVDLIPQIIIVIDPQGVPLYANQVALDYLEVSPAELPSVGFGGRFSHPEDVEAYRATRQDALARGAPFELEQRILGKDGGYRWFLFRYNGLCDEHGKASRWYVTATDIHDRRQAEEKIQNENLVLREEIHRTSMFEEIVGSSEALRKTLQHVAKVAPADSTVLILGETGTGKELIARALHKRSNRSTRAFIHVNCAAIPAALLASELFGHEKGAFTGAFQKRLGRFEAANGGTIFLDEIGDLPAETQVALLRVLQERKFERIGSDHCISVDVRVVAATNRDLRAAVTSGSFREDLFYRLNVFPIQVPSLRERADDIPLLVEYLIERYATRLGKKITNIDKNTFNLFRSYRWPGNIRELQNVIERALILGDGDTFSVDHAWFTHEAPRRSSELPEQRALRLNDQEEKHLIETALTATKGRVSGPAGAAVRLGIPRQTLESKIISLRIDKRRFTSA
jgi:formate hydrogenlyase transcriptional activator